MKKFVRRLLGAAAVVGAFAALPASATVITFDGLPATLLFPGDSVTESGYRMTAGFDFGNVDTAAVLDPSVRPTGNATQFYFNSNDGDLTVEREDGLLFNLNSFSAAFVPLNPPSSQSTALVALATDEVGAQFGVAWLFSSAFTSFSNPADFASFNRLRSVQFFACSFVGSQLCTAPTMNNGQFAIDNINVTTIPEPTTVALVLGALLAAGFSARRKNVR